jgi:sugar lactone lactonase YvrE
MSATNGPWPRDDRVEVVTGAHAGRLGEGPVWHPAAGVLAYVDVVAGLVHVVAVDGARATPVRTVEIGRPVGAVAPDGDGWVLAVENGFERRDSDWQVTWRDEVFPADGVLRFNDASVDDRGRFYAGTLAYDEDSGMGALYRLDLDGSHRVVVPRVGISNGIGWSPDRGTMYLTDSLAGLVHAYAYDEESGELGASRVFYRQPDDGAAPDGLTVDAEGGVWVALWDGARVLRLDPDGAVTDEVPMGVPRPTSLAFGGPDQTRLYVTTAWDRLTPEQRAAAPDSGQLLTFVPDVPGAPAGAQGSGATP